jgi:hypothetical protein
MYKIIHHHTHDCIMDVLFSLATLRTGGRLKQMCDLKLRTRTHKPFQGLVRADAAMEYMSVSVADASDR